MDEKYDNSYTKLSNATELLELRKRVSLEIILPHYEKRIKRSISHISKYSFFSTVFYTLSSIILAISTIISFTNMYYNTIILSSTAGILGIVSIILKEYGVYCQGREKQNSLRINALLKTIGIRDHIPDLSKYDDHEYASSISDEIKKSTSVNLNNACTLHTSVADSISDVNLSLGINSNNYADILELEELIGLRKKIILEILLPHYEKKIQSFVKDTIKWGGGVYLQYVIQYHR